MDNKKIDKYSLLEEVGRGGMAVVYRAEDTSLGRIVALKLLHPYLTEDIQARKRLQSEARAVASLNHPLIPNVFDYSGKNSKHAYIVTEFVNGITLASFLEDHRLLLAESALLILHQITTALNHAHEMGIIHRDLKPENIMITTDGQIKLMDFGISRIVENPGITSTGQILGSPAFMAPEIIKGKSSGKASDIFSLGILLYEMSTWELPFTGNNPHAVLIKIAETDYPDPESVRPEIGAPVARLIRKCMEQDPEDRPESTAALLVSIEKLLAMAGIEAKTIPALVKKLVANQNATEDELFPRVVDSFLELAKAQVATPMGQQIVARLLHLVPDNDEVNLLFDELQALERRRPWKIIAAVAAATGALILGVVIFLLMRNSPSSKVHKPHTRVAAKSTVMGKPAMIPVTNDSTPVSDMDMDPPVSLVDDGSPFDVMTPPTMEMGMEPGLSMNMGPSMRIRPVMHPQHMVKLPVMAGVQRSFQIFPFPQGQVTIILNGKTLGQWGPRPPAISSVSVGPGKHVLVFKHPLCYTKTVVIQEDMAGSKIAQRLTWRPARVIVTAPAGSAVAVRLLEGNKQTLSGTPGAPLEVSFPRIWNQPTIRASVIVAGKGIATREKEILLRAGKVFRVSY
ncbi:serine/threonine protein kinase [Myxococcota bacterium]|nr:serine/threonine protein kinase [Myxococcota bacterium]MBU1536158.1 serine/threonine protein kinase [Myxococcota bacterium]